MRSSLKAAPKAAVPFFAFTLCTFASLSLSLALAGCGGGTNQVTSPGLTRIVTGETQSVSGATVATWARLDATDKVMEVGVTMPLAVIKNPPPAASRSRSTRHAGDEIAAGEAGPAGAFIVVNFPDVVKQSTYLNHFEMHWNPLGHPPERYLVPHFDLHFYHNTVAEVKAITPPDTLVPDANRIPAGYLYAGVENTVPEMGTHAVAVSEFAPGAPPFSASMVLGYYKGQMHFVEPMITQALLLTKETITLAVPRPSVLGQVTRYPTKFTAVYHPELDAYQCTFSNFVSTTQ